MDKKSHSGDQPSDMGTSKVDLAKTNAHPSRGKSSVLKAPKKVAIANALSATKPVGSVLPVQAKSDTAPAIVSVPDFEVLSRNVARFIAGGSKVAAAYFNKSESADVKLGMSDDVADAVRTLGHVAEHWMSDPARAFDAQARLSKDFIDLWSSTLRAMSGEAAPQVAPPDAGDKRFADPKWREMPIYNFLAQAYTITTHWAQDMVREADVDAHTRDKAQFYIRQIAGAVSPSNFIATNPALLHQTIEQNGENLVRGMDMLAQDIEAGKGQLKVRQSDASTFELGVNLATTPGKVIFKNDLIELLQYEPVTSQVTKRPLLIVPPWINKFYILDLTAEKSFVRWCVSEGLSVFVISWVNPDERHAHKGFEHYMHEGIFAACSAIEAATGERDVHAIGYCVGGTLLSVALAYEAAIGKKRLASATLFATQVDFGDPGDLKVFVDEAQIAATEAEMATKGYLDGAKMANAFNMLRPNDLIWSYVVNNYMKGEAPKPFDLLTWNADATRMTQANHSFYLRNCYLNNKLAKGEMVVDGERLDLAKVTVPIYNLATSEDHIAPAASVFRGAQFFGGPMRYVLSGSGHIAGVVNPPSKHKYQYWLGAKPSGEFADWLVKAQEHPGSWWPDWLDWLRALAPETVPARHPGDGKLKILGNAPGTYVRVKA